MPSMQGPERPEAIVAEAIRHHQAGRMDEALALYEKALALRPKQVDALHLSGVLLHQRGASEAALPRLKAALVLNPQASAVHFNLGRVLRETGRLGEAIDCFRQAASLDARFDPAHYELATALDENGQYEPALEAFARALSVRPSAAAWYGAGNCLARLQRPEDAIRAYGAALGIEPRNVDAAFNLALVLASVGRGEEALAIADKLSMAINPDGSVLFKAGQICLSVGRLSLARAYFVRALALEPSHPQAGLGLAQLDLLEGRFDAGWRGHEARWRMPDLRAAARYGDRPRWTGSEEVAGKTVLVHAEQGLGDTLQFCRYLPQLAARGARVMAQVQPALESLLQRSFGSVMAVMRDGEDPGAFDLHCPMMSLPLAFGTRLETIPGAVPYLAQGPCPAWLEATKEDDGVLVGLAWSGNYRHANDLNRSIPPRCLGALFDAVRDLPGRGVRFVALQTHFRPSDRELLAAHPALLQHAPKIESFDDTAALIGRCDLVISADTSVAHLAGALGRPAWVLLPLVPDWRWMLDRDDSPWYPQARLYRQARAGDWNGVLARVGQDLRERFATSGTFGR